MIYLLDINTCIAYINRRNQAVRERLDALSPSDVALCDKVIIHLHKPLAVMRV
jgi:tRNA(fMet)-specific endonuclease VapC